MGRRRAGVAPDAVGLLARDGQLRGPAGGERQGGRVDGQPDAAEAPA